MPDKSRKLDLIAKEIEKCRLCSKVSIGKAVPGEGNPDADIVFIGEAPRRCHTFSQIQTINSRRF